MIKIGVIGLGNMGMLHLMNCLKMEDVRVVAAADSSKRVLKKVDSLGVKNLYSDYEILLNEESKNLDAVIISLPNFLHYDSIKLSLESGLNVFIEKPMAINIDECKKIVKLVEKSGRKLMPGHVMRYHDYIKKMKQEYDNGKIGSLEIVTMESIQNGPLSHGRIPKPISEWWFDPKKSGGGALLDLGYHLIDLFNYFTGDSRAIFCQLGHKYNLPVEDGATVILNSKEKSIRGVINVGWFEKTIFPRFNSRVILHGNADFLSSEKFKPKNIYLYAIKEGIKNFLRKISGKDIHPLSYTYYYEATYIELKDFFDKLKYDLEIPISAVDALKTIKIIEEAYRLFMNKS
ncbi:MAG: Gfo/Idh/MocA family protein [Candidatus Helarchaeota archaeon]